MSVLRSIGCLSMCLACLVGCARFAEAYDKEYVLWDSRDRAAADARASTDSRSSEPLEAVDRIFALEAEAAELERAIREGLDEDGALATRHAALDAQIVALKREHGDEYLSARRERLREMAERGR